MTATPTVVQGSILSLPLLGDSCGGTVTWKGELGGVSCQVSNEFVYGGLLAAQDDLFLQYTGVSFNPLLPHGMRTFHNGDPMGTLTARIWQIYLNNLIHWNKRTRMKIFSFCINSTTVNKCSFSKYRPPIFCTLLEITVGRFHWNGIFAGIFPWTFKSIYGVVQFR